MTVSRVSPMRILYIRALPTRRLPVLLIFLYGVLSGPTPVGAAETGETKRGSAEELIQALGCKACHTIQDDGGSLAPDLTQVGSRLTAAQIQQRLSRHNDPDSTVFMPDYSTVAPADLERISHYLYELR